MSLKCFHVSLINQRFYVRRHRSYVKCTHTENLKDTASIAFTMRASIVGENFGDSGFRESRVIIRLYPYKSGLLFHDTSNEFPMFVATMANSSDKSFYAYKLRLLRGVLCELINELKVTKEQSVCSYFLSKYFYQSILTPVKHKWIRLFIRSIADISILQIFGLICLLG